MPGPLSDYSGRAMANVRMRIDSVTKGFPEDFKNQGIVPAILNLGSRFGKNNRALIGR